MLTDNNIYKKTTSKVQGMSSRQQVLFLLQKTQKEANWDMENDSDFQDEFSQGYNDIDYQMMGQDYKGNYEENKNFNHKIMIPFNRKEELQLHPERFRLMAHSLSQFYPIKKNKYLERKRNILSEKEANALICTCQRANLKRNEKTNPHQSFNCDLQCINRCVYTECSPLTCPSDIAQKKGWGLFAGEFIPKGTYIMQYVGEVFSVDSDIGQQRIAKYKHSTCTYLMKTTPSEVIDPTYVGNIARFINHSCDPNCVTQKWNVVGEVCVGIFALKDIKENEELSFDYQFDFFKTPFTKCYCGTSKCKGFLGILATNTSDNKLDSKAHMSNEFNESAPYCSYCKKIIIMTQKEDVLVCKGVEREFFHFQCVLQKEGVAKSDIDRKSFFCRNCEMKLNGRKKRGRKSLREIEEIVQTNNSFTSSSANVINQEINPLAQRSMSGVDQYFNRQQSDKIANNLFSNKNENPQEDKPEEPLPWESTNPEVAKFFIDSEENRMLDRLIAKEYHQVEKELENKKNRINNSGRTSSQFSDFYNFMFALTKRLKIRIKSDKHGQYKFRNILEKSSDNSLMNTKQNKSDRSYLISKHKRHNQLTMRKENSQKIQQRFKSQQLQKKQSQDTIQTKHILEKRKLRSIREESSESSSDSVSGRSSSSSDDDDNEESKDNSISSVSDQEENSESEGDSDSNIDMDIQEELTEQDKFLNLEQLQINQEEEEEKAKLQQFSRKSNIPIQALQQVGVGSERLISSIERRGSNLIGKKQSPRKNSYLNTAEGTQIKDKKQMIENYIKKELNDFINIQNNQNGIFNINQQHLFQNKSAGAKPLIKTETRESKLNVYESVFNKVILENIDTYELIDHLQLYWEEPWGSLVTVRLVSTLNQFVFMQNLVQQVADKMLKNGLLNGKPTDNFHTKMNNLLLNANPNLVFFQNQQYDQHSSNLVLNSGVINNNQNEIIFRQLLSNLHPFIILVQNVPKNFLRKLVGYQEKELTQYKRSYQVDFDFNRDLLVDEVFYMNETTPLRIFGKFQHVIQVFELIEKRMQQIQMKTLLFQSIDCKLIMDNVKEIKTKVDPCEMRVKKLVREWKDLKHPFYYVPNYLREVVFIGSKEEIARAELELQKFLRQNRSEIYQNGTQQLSFLLPYSYLSQMSEIKRDVVQRFNDQIQFFYYEPTYPRKHLTILFIGPWQLIIRAKKYIEDKVNCTIDKSLRSFENFQQMTFHQMIRFSFKSLKRFILEKDIKYLNHWDICSLFIENAGKQQLQQNKNESNQQLALSQYKSEQVQRQMSSQPNLSLNKSESLLQQLVHQNSCQDQDSQQSLLTQQQNYSVITKQSQQYQQLATLTKEEFNSLIDFLKSDVETCINSLFVLSQSEDTLGALMKRLTVKKDELISMMATVLNENINEVQKRQYPISNYQKRYSYHNNQFYNSTDDRQSYCQGGSFSVNYFQSSGNNQSSYNNYRNKRQRSNSSYSNQSYAYSQESKYLSKQPYQQQQPFQYSTDQQYKSIIQQSVPDFNISDIKAQENFTHQISQPMIPSIQDTSMHQRPIETHPKDPIHVYNQYNSFHNQYQHHHHYYYQKKIKRRSSSSCSSNQYHSDQSHQGRIVDKSSSHHSSSNRHHEKKRKHRSRSKSSRHRHSHNYKKRRHHERSGSRRDTRHQRSSHHHSSRKESQDVEQPQKQEISEERKKLLSQFKHKYRDHPYFRKEVKERSLLSQQSLKQLQQHDKNRGGFSYQPMSSEDKGRKNAMMNMSNEDGQLD